MRDAALDVCTRALVAHATASCSVLELAKLLIGLFPERGLHVKKDGMGHAGSVVNRDPPRQLDVSKLCSLGWSPHVEIQEGFQRTVRSLL